MMVSNGATVLSKLAYVEGSDVRVTGIGVWAAAPVLETPSSSNLSFILKICIPP